MNATEARQFVARWTRILIPWFVRTEDEVIRALERSCVGMMGGGLLIFTITCTHMRDSVFDALLTVFGLLHFGVSFWLVLKFRAAHRVLAKSAIANRKS